MRNRRILISIIFVSAVLSSYPALSDHFSQPPFQTNPPVPAISVQPAQSLPGASVTQLPGRPRLGIFQSLPTIQTSSFQQLSDTRLRFNYDVRPAGTFAALSIQFDNLGTSQIESVDLSVASSLNFVFASQYSCPSGSKSHCFSLELVDVGGNIFRTPFRETPATGRLVSVPRDYIYRLQPPAFRLDRVRFMNFVFDQGNTTPATRTGWVELEIGGLYTVPSVRPDPTKSTSDVTVLPGVKQLVVFASQPPLVSSTANLDSQSKSFFKINYQVPAGGFAGSITSFDDFGTVPVETQSLAGKTLVFSLRDAGKLGTVTMEVEDYFHQKAEVALTGVDATERFYSVPTNLFQGIDITRVRSIVFVIKEEAIRGITTEQMEAHLRQSAEYQNRGGRDAELVEGLYLDLLGRTADAGGLAYWVHRLKTGTPLAAIAQGFRSSGEFAARINSLLPSAMKNAFGRDATAQEYADWSGRLTRGEVDWTELTNELVKYAQSRGASAAHVRTQHQAIIQNLYQSYFGRAADSGGLAYFVGRLESGAKVSQLITAIRSSPEYMQDFGRAHQVRRAYNRLLGREPDAAGFDYWTQQLKKPISTLEIRLGDHPFTPIVRPTPPSVSSLSVTVPYDPRLQRRLS